MAGNQSFSQALNDLSAPMIFVPQGSQLPQDWLMAHSDYVRFPAKLVLTRPKSAPDDASGKESRNTGSPNNRTAYASPNFSAANPGTLEAGGDGAANSRPFATTPMNRELTPANGLAARSGQSMPKENPNQSWRGGRISFPKGGLVPPPLLPLPAGSLAPHGIENPAILSASYAPMATGDAAKLEVADEHARQNKRCTNGPHD